jgi:hypothetical protein
MAKIKVDLEELMLSFGFDDEELAKEYFDRETGEIINIPNEVMRVFEGKLRKEELDDWQRELLEDTQLVLGDCENRYLSIPNVKDSYFYNAMLQFTEEAVNDLSIKERLMRALNSNRPMPEFKSALISYPEEQEQWYEYEDKKIKEYVIQWLKENKIEFEYVEAYN